MRVLQLVQRPQRRGAEVFAYELSQQLRALGDSVRTVYLYDYEGSVPLPVETGDVCLGHDSAAVGERIPGIQLSLLQRVIHEIHRFQPDIVQANGGRTVKYGAMAKIAAGRAAPWRLVYRNIDMPKFWNVRWHSRIAYRKVFMPSVDGVIGVSSASLEQAIELYELSVPRLAIRNGIDTRKLDGLPTRDEVRNRIGASERDLILLFLGSLVPQKRPDRFVRVLESVAGLLNNVSGWMVGDGPMKSEILQMIETTQMQDKCKLLGYQERVGEFIRGADLLIMTSDTEGIPAVALEAGYLGVPVVATNVGALSECVENGITGVLVGEPFEAGLVKAIVDLASRVELRRALGRNGEAFVRQKFTMEVVGSEYRDFYAAITGL